jgi:hypothetical protein
MSVPASAPGTACVAAAMAAARVLGLRGAQSSVFYTTLPASTCCQRHQRNQSRRLLCCRKAPLLLLPQRNQSHHASFEHDNVV